MYRPTGRHSEKCPDCIKKVRAKILENRKKKNDFKKLFKEFDGEIKKLEKEFNKSETKKAFNQLKFKAKDFKEFENLNLEELFN